MPNADVDIELCAREPIHIPGAIQPYGALLVLGEPDLTILQASRSCGSLFCRGPERLLGRPLSELFGAGQIAPLLRDLSPQGLQDQNPLDLSLPVEQEHRRYEATAHRHDGLLILELERAPPKDGPDNGPKDGPGQGDQGPSSLSFYQMVSQSISRLQATVTAAEAAATAAEQIAQLSGFDRVMIYRFDQNWDGEVVAEVKRKDMEPYLGLRYPASDIPAQARRLFTLNRLRLIADVDYVPSPIVPQDNPRTGRPSDLSLSLLRSASPVHIEYLQNMGVKATLTISILVEGSLWGLIACHHSSPRHLPHQVRTACEFLGQIISLHITTVEAREDRVQRARLQQVHERIALALREGDLFTALGRSWDSLLQLTGAGGAAVCLHDRLALFGNTPTEEQTLALVDWLRLRERSSGANSDMLNTKCLSEIYPAAAAYKDQAAGLLALPLLQDGAGVVLWFRPEVIQTVSWAGDPRKSLQPGGGGRLHPRLSFALWQEILSRHSAPFRSWDIAAAVDVRHAIISRAAQDEKQATDVAVGVAQAATRELRAAQQQLVATARQAGMAEIAIGILHNVGNALNSVNVSATTIQERVRDSRVSSLVRTASLLSEHKDHLPSYLGQDPKGKQIPGFVIMLADRLEVERQSVLGELVGLIQGVDHIQEIVRTQQSYAGSYNIVDKMKLEEVVEDALRMSGASLVRHGVKVKREFADLPPLLLDKHKVLQILLNLMSNAKCAMDATPEEDRVMTLRTESSGASVRISVADRGIGVAKENLTRIFSQGFTTRTDGHGFGLHASALAAQDMKGALTLHSDGPGRGATFTLAIPR